jgi:hypothetical protein
MSRPAPAAGSGQSHRVPSAVAAAAALLLSAGASAAPVVWNTGTGTNGNSYELISDPDVSWDAARAAAQSRGGDLATISSAEEQAFVESLLSGANVLTGGYWFGIREVSEGVYQNVDGSPLTYAHWATGEPNNALGIENVGQILWTDPNLPLPDPAAAARSGFWNDAPTAGYTGGVDQTPSDTFRSGYLVEIAADDTGGGDDGGNPAAVPLPAALYAFPVGAGFVGIFYRRMRRSA